MPSLFGSSFFSITGTITLRLFKISAYVFIELSRDQQKATRGFIEERTATAKKELKDAEDKLTEYKKANDIIAPDDAVKLATEKMGMVVAHRHCLQKAAANALRLLHAQQRLRIVHWGSYRQIYACRVFSKDIMPFLSAAYYVNEIKNNDD